MAKGYISVHRKIWDTDIWKSSDPFDMRSAWIDLLLMANHADNECVRGKSVIKINRGQLHTSYDHLAKRWSWSRGKVQRFIRLLNELDMVVANGTANGTTLTIVNYGVYQDRRYANGTTNDITNGTTNRPTNGTTNGSLTIMNNNVSNNETNNVKKGKESVHDIFEKMRREGQL